MKWLALFVLLIGFNTSALSESFTGKVVAVSDGDTVRVLRENKSEIKVRLADIDAPEKEQPYGEQAKLALSKMVFGRDVVVEWTKKDRYGRTVGRIKTIGIPHRPSTKVNMKMVGLGHAWVYRRYSNDAALLLLENNARKMKLGLWALQADQITPPWEWRKNKRHNSLP